MGIINALPIGTILESKERQYKIEKIIGHGAFGITYQAETSVRVSDMVGEIWLKVCIKEFFMHDYNSRNSDGSLTETTGESILGKYKSSFTKEANNLARLDNRNIVKVLDVIRAFNTCYIVMEYISGSNLDDYIKQKDRLEEKEAIRIAKEIAKAVGYMHSKKMLHLDLKPKNVMIDEDGGVHVIDFGLSKQYDNNGEPESSTTLGSGTEGYAPLEQGSPSDEQYFPVTIDVYALGGTLFKMLTGEKPPSASTVLNSKDILEKKLNAHQVSPQMVSLIKHAMQPMKGNRIPSMEAFITEIDDNSQEVSDEETVVDKENKNIVSKQDETLSEPNLSNIKRLMLFAILFGVLLVILLLSLLGTGKKKDSPILEDADVENNEIEIFDEEIVDSAVIWEMVGDVQGMTEEEKIKAFNEMKESLIDATYSAYE